MIKINSVSKAAIFDTGTGISIIGGQYFDNFLRNSIELIFEKDIRILAANGQNMEVRGHCWIEIEIGWEKQKKELFKVIEEIKNDVIIGNDIMKSWGLKIDFDNEQIELSSGEYTYEHV